MKNNSFGKELGLLVSNYGLEVLRSPVGGEEFIKNHIGNRFSEIAQILKKLTRLADMFPQQASITLSKCIKHKATYLHRTLPDCQKYSGTYDNEMEIFQRLFLIKS